MQKVVGSECTCCLTFLVWCCRDPSSWLDPTWLTNLDNPFVFPIETLWHVHIWGPTLWAQKYQYDPYIWLWASFTHKETENIMSSVSTMGLLSILPRNSAIRVTIHVMIATQARWQCRLHLGRILPATLLTPVCSARTLPHYLPALLSLFLTISSYHSLPNIASFQFPHFVHTAPSAMLHLILPFIKKSFLSELFPATLSQA